MRTGIYFFKTKNLLNGTFSQHSTKVNIISESGLSYLIEFKKYTDKGDKPGQTSWVRKHHVKYLSKSERQVISCTCILDEVRFPYKD